jgi:hypothetical protein
MDRGNRCMPVKFFLSGKGTGNQRTDIGEKYLFRHSIGVCLVRIHYQHIYEGHIEGSDQSDSGMEAEWHYGTF